jgi:hypothetical protein
VLLQQRIVGRRRHLPAGLEWSHAGCSPTGGCGEAAPPAGRVYRGHPRRSILVERSPRRCSTLGFEGVAMVEYKVETASGTPYLMEINGRFWGSLQLAVDAGVDFPRLLAESALGADTGPVPAYKVGVRSRWWWGDVDQLLTRLIRPRASLACRPGPGAFGRCGISCPVAPGTGRICGATILSRSCAVARLVPGGESPRSSLNPSYEEGTGAWRPGARRDEPPSG